MIVGLMFFYERFLAYEMIDLVFGILASIILSYNMVTHNKDFDQTHLIYALVATEISVVAYSFAYSHFRTLKNAHFVNVNVIKNAVLTIVSIILFFSLDGKIRVFEFTFA